MEPIDTNRPKRWLVPTAQRWGLRKASFQDQRKMRQHQPKCLQQFLWNEPKVTGIVEKQEGWKCIDAQWIFGMSHFNFCTISSNFGCFQSNLFFREAKCSIWKIPQMTQPLPGCFERWFFSSLQKWADAPKKRPISKGPKKRAVDLFTWRQVESSGWWFQPIWKIFVKMGSSSPNRGENSKNLWVATT